MKLRIFNILLISMLWVGLASGVEQRSISSASQNGSHRYLQRTWTSEDGLPQNTVTAITQTRDGYLWLGTFGGLVRFDGIRFATFTSHQTEGLKSDRIKSLLEDREGSLWISTQTGGLSRYRQGTFTSFTTAEGLPGNDVAGVREDASGNLWVATSDGVARFQNGRFRTYQTLDELPANPRKGPTCTDCLFPQADGSFLMGTYGGLVRFLDDKLTWYPLPRTEPANWVTSIAKDRDGNLWVGTKSGLYRFENGTLSPVANAEFSSISIRSLVEDSAGVLWIITEPGRVYAFRNGSLETHPLTPEIDSLVVYSIGRDREGTLWVGTDNNGLHRLREPRISVYPKEPEFEKYGVVPITEDNEGNLYLGATCSGLLKLDRSTGKSTRIDLGENKNCVWSLLAARDGSLWVGTWNGGLTRIQNGALTSYGTRNSSLSSNVVLALYQDGGGTVWAGTANGLNRFQDGNFKVFHASEGLVNDDVRFITEDREGALLIGTVGGMSRYKDGRFTNYTTKDGLSNNFVRGISTDADGTIWIGTYGGGLSRFKDGRFVNLTTRNGLFNDYISRFLEDDQGNIWMSSNRGIFSVRRKQLNDFADGKITAISSAFYDVSDGMKSSEANGGGQPAGWRTRDGKLWFATINGAVVIDPRETNNLPPPVVVEQLILNGAPLDTRGDGRRMEIAQGAGNLEILYTGLSFVAPEKMRFKYKLEGYDADWVDAGTRRVAYYTNIPPGEYRFRVLAANSDGVWNETGANYGFYLRPHFYQTVPFYLLSVMSIVLLGVGGYRLRVRQLVRRTHSLEQKVAERTREVVEQSNKLAQSNDKLAEVNERLEQSNEDMLATLNQLRLGVAITNEDGTITFLSEAAERLTGLSNDAAVGRNWEEVLPLSAQDRADLKSVLQLPQRERTKLLTRVAAPNGLRYWMEIEVQDDPRDSRRKFFCLYDVSEIYDLRHLLNEKAKFHELVGDSARMQLVFKQIKDVAMVDATVLIEGETGTGKELVARAIHYTGNRKSKPFIAVNCAGLTESLVASQLFGHKRGSFTGAVSDQVGLFEAADGGTLFLDEIGDIPAGVQTSLLRVLQEREITRIGESRPRKVNVRVIAATHRDLNTEVAAGRFRQDLLYRIRVTQIHLPALRERREDIPQLVAWFLGQFSRAEGKQVRDVSRDAMQVLIGHNWTGNIRELKSVIESAVIYSSGQIIQAADLSASLNGAKALGSPAAVPPSPAKGPIEISANGKKERIEEALAKTNGNRAAAARLLGVSRSTLYNWLQELDLDE